MSNDFHREKLRLEFTIVVRFVVFSLPLGASLLVMWLAFSVEEVHWILRAVVLWLVVFWSYLVLRHFFASASAWETLELEFEQWLMEQDTARVIRLGVSSQDDARVQIVQPERIVPVHSARGVVRTMGGFDVQELAEFVDRAFALGRFGTSERNWLGYKFSSGRVIDTVDDWRSLLAVFARPGLLVNVGVERECARWIVHNAQVVKESMNLPMTTPLLEEKQVESAVM